MIKCKYRLGTLKLAREKGLLTPYLHYLRFKMIGSSGRFLHGSYVEVIQNGLGLTLKGKPLCSTYIGTVLKQLLTAGFATKILNSRGIFVGYQLISTIDSWILIEGLEPLDKRRTSDTLAKLTKSNINQLDDSVVLFFKTVPFKKDLENRLYAADISSWIASTAQKNQQNNDDTDCKKVKTAAFQKDNTGGAIASLSRLAKNVFGCKRTSTAHGITERLSKGSFIKKDSRLIPYTEEEIEQLWLSYCYFRYKKYSSAQDWMRDTAHLLELGGEYTVQLPPALISPYLTVDYSMFIELSKPRFETRRNDVIVPDSYADELNRTHIMFTKLIDGEDLTALEQNLYDDISEANMFTAPSPMKKSFLDPEEFENYSKQKSSGVFPSDFLKSLCNIREYSGASKRVVMVKKVPHRVLANEYHLHKDSTCKVIKGHRKSSSGNSIILSHLPANIQKISLSSESELQEKLQSSTIVIVTE